MPGKHFYEYAIIRLVPRVEREEFINIGVILYSKNTKFLRCKFHVNQEKINLFCSEMDWEAVQNNISAFEKICTGASDGGLIATWEISERFRWLTAQRSASIQTSRPHNGFSDDLEETLSKLFQEQVL